MKIKKWGNGSGEVRIKNETWVTIENHEHYFGYSTESPNKQYILRWHDDELSVDAHGKENQRNGFFILLAGNNILLYGEMARPNDGHVANNGIFAFSDWGDRIFYIVDKEGKILLKHTFSANFISSGLSSDGKWAACQIADGDGPDSDKLAFFDVGAGKLLWQIEPDTGWADSYEFDTEGRLLRLFYKDLGGFAYNFLGEFCDKDKWREQVLKNGSCWQIISIAQEALYIARDTNNASAFQSVLEILDKALQKASKIEPKDPSQVHRLIGETYELMGQKENAVEHFEIAFKLYPKIGVVQKLKKLKSALNKYYNKMVYETLKRL